MSSNKISHSLNKKKIKANIQREVTYIKTSFFQPLLQYEDGHLITLRICQHTVSDEKIISNYLNISELMQKTLSYWNSYRGVYIP